MERGVDKLKIEYPVIDAFYQHYKGGLYQVLSMAKHTETDELLVICKSIHFGTWLARPLSKWSDVVGSTDIGNEPITRFTLVKKT